MKLLFLIAGGVLIVFGGIFFLQGINVLPGSFMTGHREWAVYGGIMIAVGLGAIYWSRRRR